MKNKQHFLHLKFLWNIILPLKSTTVKLSIKMNPTHSFPQRENVFAQIENFCPFLNIFPQRKALNIIFIIPVYQRQTLLPFLILLMHAFSATHPPTMCLTSTPCFSPSTQIFQLTITDPLADQPPHSSDSSSIPSP